MLRRATTTDAGAVAETYLASRRGLEFLPSVHTDDETRAWVGSTLLLEHEVCVALADGQVVGFAAIRGDSLGHLYVRPEAQGQGVGSELLRWVKERRPRGFELWVFQANTGARRFYERHGFRCVELTDGSGNEERTPDARYAWRP